MFDIGEEVICIDNSPGWAYGEPCPLVKGTTYIVLDLKPEFPSIEVTGDRGVYWSYRRFRRPFVDKSRLEIINEALV